MSLDQHSLKAILGAMKPHFECSTKIEISDETITLQWSFYFQDQAGTFQQAAPWVTVDQALIDLLISKANKGKGYVNNHYQD